jgi:hypothetical protein
MEWKEKTKEKLLEHSVAAVVALIGLLLSIIWLAIPSEAWSKISEATPKRVLWALLGLESIALIGLIGSLYKKPRKKTLVRGMGVAWEYVDDGARAVCPTCEIGLFIKHVQDTYDILQCPKCKVEIPLISDNNQPFHLLEARRRVEEFRESRNLAEK